MVRFSHCRQQPCPAEPRPRCSSLTERIACSGSGQFTEPRILYSKLLRVNPPKGPNLDIKPPTGYTSVSPLLKNHRVVLPSGDKAPPFARNIHALPVSFNEIAPASRDYPVAFSSGDGGKTFTLTAILGLQHNQNMFLMEDGYWDRRVYLPAYVRRFPFCMARVTRDGELQSERVVCVEDSAITNDGDELFDTQGEPLPVWSQIQDFVTEYERDLMRAEEFCKLLAGLDLLEPISVTAELGEFKMELAGLYRVNRDALDELPEDALRALLKDEAMEAIFVHLWSMANFQRMLNRRSIITPPVDTDTAARPN